ncbi:ERCC4 domain-containing protein [Dichotomopilus funicola]|uniref:ERCC4 domain-containing protein n=1 Tax=Dichotomopilus funicola TaxID=1934379 RepID=A0AAN6ZN46_9PEZI|nr:ERCC4 domain-containing protein [Dichotomopilus funicola]
MPTEVISLLSSSDAGSPPPARAAQPQPLPAPLQSTRLDILDSDDLFPPLPSPGRLTGTAPPGLTGVAQRQPQALLTSADEIWLLSDDNPISLGNSHSKDGVSIGEPSAKRQCLDLIGVVSSPNAAAPLQSTTSTPLRTSGPGCSDQTAVSLIDTTRPQRRRNWRNDDPLRSLSPFATKRIAPGSHNDPVAVPSSSLQDDTFAASPVPPLGNVPAKNKGIPPVLADDIDVFATSSPVRVVTSTRPGPSTATWDPISSSAPLPSTTEEPVRIPSRPFRKTVSEVIALDESDRDSVAQHSSDDEFPDLDVLLASKEKFGIVPKPPTAPTAPKVQRKPKPTKAKADSDEPKKTTKERAKEKEEKAAAREAEKERKKLEKQRAKEEKAQEKAKAAALAEVNKIRTDKKVSTPEMIVDLPITLDESVKLQAGTLLRDLDVHSTTWQSPVDNIVQWRRKVSSRYNEDLGHWEPIMERIERENYAMVVIPASQFVDLVLGEEDVSLESHVSRIKRLCPKDNIIYLIEGLTIWLRKNRNVRNRQFVSAVRSGLEPLDEGNDQQQQQQQQPPPSSQPQRKRKAAATPQTYIDEETIETSLLQLQVLHGVLIHHTSIPLETARWIAVFTQHISTVPYRRQREAANDAGFCMETGQVKTGDGTHDTYVRILQEIGRVTAPTAYGIAAEFESVSALVRGLEEGGPLRLEKVRRSINKDGELSDRTVGQAVSKRVHKIFLGRDETSTDI